MKNETPIIGELTITDILYAQKHELSYEDMVNFKHEMKMIDEAERICIAKSDAREGRDYNTPQETVHFAW